jgi:nudix-type nucleoside diphosphatase (YffH/AdpP family)
MKVKVLNKKVVFNDFYKITEATFEFEKNNGEMTEPITRLCFERGDSVAGIVYNTDTQQAILVRQFRWPAYEKGPGKVTEVVAGMLKEGEDPEVAMRREVEEEIGYTVAHIEHVSTFYVSPGGSSERVFTYYIEVRESGKVNEGGGLAEESEHIEVVNYSITELREAIKEGGVPDAKSIIACNYLLEKVIDNN